MRKRLHLLYLSQRRRPDIYNGISFLCTRLNYPTLNIFKKLTRVLKYLQGSTYLPLRLSCDNYGEIRWWVGASHGTHSDMKTQSGGSMPMGGGSVYSTSIKQKLVTQSSKVKLWVYMIHSQRSSGYEIS
jgi:hypothetical protein